MDPLPQAILTLSTGGIGAAIGAWIGARVALDRFKKERAFDRRIEWYERTIQLLHRVRLLTSHLKSAMYGIEQTAEGVEKPPPEVYELREETMNQLNLAYAESELYASGSARAALLEFNEKLEELSDTFSEQVIGHAPAPVLRKTQGEIGHALRKAAIALAKDVRSELRLEPLPEDLVGRGQQPDRDMEKLYQDPRIHVK